MTHLTPAEDAEMFSKTAAWLTILDEGDMVELMMELAMYNAERVVEMKLACDTVLAGLEEMEAIDPEAA